MEIIDFIREFYTLVFVWLACLTAFFSCRRYRVGKFKAFVVFIIAMALVETGGNYMAFKSIRNHFYFNIYYILQFAVVPWFFYNWLDSNTVKSVIKIYSFIFPAFVLVNSIWLQHFSSLLTYTLVLGGSFVFLLSVLYIWQLYAGDEVNSLRHYPVFWISLAYLFYYAFVIPYLGMLNYIWAFDKDVTRKLYVLYNLGIILHSIFLIIGFLCLRPTTMK